MRHNHILGRSGLGPLDPRGLYTPLRDIGPIISTENATSADYYAYLQTAIEHSATYDHLDDTKTAIDYSVPLILAVHRGETQYITRLKTMIADWLAWAETHRAAGNALFSPGAIPTIHSAYNAIHAHAALTNPEIAWLQNTTVWLLQNLQTWGIPRTEEAPYGLVRGSHHRSSGQWAGMAVAAAKYPNHDDAGLWESHSALLWSDFWDQRDIESNDNNYFFSALGARLAGLMLVPNDAFFTDALAQERFWKRILFEVSSDGTPPVWSVSGQRHSFAGTRIFALEMAAARIVAAGGDATLAGHYRWMASRIFRWTVANISPLYPLKGGFSPGWETYKKPSVNGLALAAMVMNDAIVPIEPSAASQFTTRAQIKRLSVLEGNAITNDVPIETGLWNFAPQKPGKLIFRSSWEPGSLFAMMECFPSHDPLNMTAIYAFERWGAAATEPSNEKYEHGLENVASIFNLDGPEPIGPNSANQCDSSVPVFEDGALATHAVLQVEDHLGFPVTQVREVLFVKDRFMLLRDQATFTGDATNVSLGPQWNTNEVVAFGDNWFDGYWWDFASTLPNPPYYVNTGYKNPRWNTLVYHPLNEDAELTIPETKETLRYRVRYHVDGPRQTGDALQFGTLLIPHSPGTAADIVAGITVLHDAPGLLAMTIALGKRWEFVLLNPNGQTVSVPAPTGTFATTAKALYLDCGHGKERGREEWP